MFLSTMSLGVHTKVKENFLIFGESFRIFRFVFTHDNIFLEISFVLIGNRSCKSAYRRFICNKAQWIAENGIVYVFLVFPL